MEKAPNYKHKIKSTKLQAPNNKQITITEIPMTEKYVAKIEYY